MIGKKQPKKIGNIIENYLKYNGYGDILVKNRINEKWKKIAGKNISKISEVSEYSEGILFIKVQSSSWRNELQFHKNELLQKIKKDKKLREISTIIFR